MKRLKIFLCVLFSLVVLSACGSSNTLPGSVAASMPTAKPMMKLSSTSGTMSNPTYVQDTEAGTCANWHISVDAAHPFDGCAAHMVGRKIGDYILLGPDSAHLKEYQITAIQNGSQKVAVKLIQSWIPDGTKQHPYLILVYEGICSDVWGVTFEGVGMDPLCTVTMPARRPGQYVQLAGANQSGEFFVQTVDVAAKAVVIG